MEAVGDELLTKVCPYHRKCNIGPVTVAVGDEMNSGDLQSYFCHQKIDADSIELSRQKTKAKHHHSLVRCNL